MNPTVQQGLVAFRPRARLLRLIGAELISDEVLAVTELVKNAHDADASEVILEFRRTSGPEGEIVVRDDGTGMDLDTLLGQWMQPAATTKRDPAFRVTRRGRRVLGEKGVGRFATDKLARRLELISRRKGEDRELRAVFDWEEFDTDVKMLSEVKSRWELRPASMDLRHGTILRLSGLQAAWSERMFRRLSTRLSRLLSPFQEHDSFRIRIESDEFPRYSGQLRPEFADRAPHRLEALFDGRQTIEVNVNGSRSVKHLWNGQGDLRCGPVRVRIYAFDLESAAVASIGPQLEVRAWLREWSGISIYRDGFRVWPYGEPQDDWLRLDQRRVNNPVLRLSNNQVVGFVEITRDGNPELADQTSREGLLHNRAYEDLRRLLNFVLQLLEAERQAIRHPRSSQLSASARREASGHSVADALDRLAGKAGTALGRELTSLARQAREEASRQELCTRRFLGAYSDLAALGHAATALSRSLHPYLDQMWQACARIRETLKPRGRAPVLPAMRSVEGALAIISDRIAMLTPMESRTNHGRRGLDVLSELHAFVEMVQPLLTAAGVTIAVKSSDRSILRIEMRPETFHRLLYILATNSLDWLEGIREPRIQVSIRTAADRCEILFSDNGPGIPPEIGEKIFDPAFSGRESGLGMGLAIARNIVEFHRGEIIALADKRRRGAAMRILMPRKRSRATVDP